MNNDMIPVGTTVHINPEDIKWECNGGDLISREALKKAMQTEIANVPQPDTDADYYVGVKQGLKLAETIIDNAPSVEYPFYQEAYQTGYEEGYAQGYIDGSTGADWRGDAE